MFDSQKKSIYFYQCKKILSSVCDYVSEMRPYASSSDRKSFPNHIESLHNKFMPKSFKIDFYSFYVQSVMNVIFLFYMNILNSFCKKGIITIQNS